MMLPIGYDADRGRAEQVLLDVARRHTVKINELSEGARRELERRYVTKVPEMAPRVYYRLTDNWLELAVRFLAEEHGIRELKDRMSREILAGFDAAGIGIASSTYDVVGVPPLRIVDERGERDGGNGRPGNAPVTAGANAPPA